MQVYSKIAPHILSVRCRVDTLCGDHHFPIQSLRPYGDASVAGLTNLLHEVRGLTKACSLRPASSTVLLWNLSPEACFPIHAISFFDRRYRLCLAGGVDPDLLDEHEGYGSRKTTIRAEASIPHTLNYRRTNNVARRWGNWSKMARSHARLCRRS